jgi:integrase
MTETKKRRRPRGEGSVFKIPRSRFWRIAYTNLDGVRIEESSMRTMKTDATEVLRQRLLKIRGGEVAIPRVEQTTFDQAAENLIDSYTNQGMKSTDDLERRIVKHLKPFFGGRRLISVDAASTVAYTKDRLQEKASPATVNRELAVLRQIFTLARDQKLIGFGSIPRIEMLNEKGRTRKGFFEKEELDAVVRHLPSDLQGVVRFAAVTGWRLDSEVLPLTWDRVSFEENEVRLHEGQTKNGEGRVFPLTPELRSVLKAQRVAYEALTSGSVVDLKTKTFDHVFFRLVAEGRGGPKKPEPIRSITKAWRNACKLAGVRNRIPHDLRRTAARNFIRSGMSETVAMKLTGHLTRSVFDRYNITSADDLRQAAEKLHAFTVSSSTSSKTTSKKRGGRRS